MDLQPGRGPAWNAWQAFERMVVRANSFMLFCQRYCDKGDIVWINGANQCARLCEIWCETFKGNDRDGCQEKRNTSSASPLRRVAAMCREFIKGKSGEKKLKIRKEQNSSCDRVFNECGDQNIRIENQSHAFKTLA